MKRRRPPVLADRFLNWFCKDEFVEEIQGDLYEFYDRMSGKYSQLRVILSYWYHVFNFLRPFAIKKIQGQNLIYTSMLKSNLIIAFRNLSKYRFYTGLNITGLALGLACCIFIIIWVNDEMSYDTFYDNHERVYRVSSDLKFQDNLYKMAVSPAPMAESFKSEFPEIIEAGRLRTRGSTVYKKGDRFIDQDHIFFADPDILSIFSFEFIYGDKEQALREPNTVVITESVARKFFDQENPVGLDLTNSVNKSFRVDGVIKDSPGNSHFHPAVMMSMKGDNQSTDGVWLSNNYNTYFLLDESNDPRALEDKFILVYPKYFGPQLEAYAGANWDQVIASGSYVNYYLTRLTDIHLHSDLDYEIEANGDIEYVYMFGAIGVFILIIACINFMNISTARAMVRAKEVGIRKVLGSFRYQLVFQFLIETLLFSLMALVLAILITIFVMPLFVSLTGKQIDLPLGIGMDLWLLILFGTMGIGLLAGFYPALILSGFKPVMVLKGQLRSGKSGTYVRSILVVFQFSISIILIVGTAVVYQQLNFVQNKKLGFNKEGVLILNNTFTLGDQLHTFKQELLNIPEITGATITGFLPTNFWRSDSQLQPGNATNTEGALGCQIWGVDTDYIKTMGMKIVAGRDFSREIKSDSSAVLLNETAAKRFGFDVIGKKLKTIGDFEINGRKEVTVIGIVEDFHFDSMRDNIVPMVIMLDDHVSTIAARYESTEVKSIVGDIEDLWNEFNPRHPLDYDFMDRQYNAKYDAEMKLGTIFTVFGVFTIIIACLGLFGLSAFTAEQRRKEIGIRKVLGASVANLVSLLFTSYTRLLIVSIIIGLPLGYLLMNSWLDDFAYHTEISLGLLLLSALLSLLVAWLTVSAQSMKAARVNPVENLRYE